MSTLTSTQLNVKRSSTRVHGPPGGASQLTFGPGGFGTNAPAPEPDAENRDAVQQSRADFIPQKPGLRTPYQQGTSNNQQQYSNQQQAPPPTALAPPQTGYGRPPPTGYAPPSTGYAPPQTAGGYGGYKPPTTGYSQQGQERPQTMGWGQGASGRTQPPLTSSKRDQNWEKKRRQWLARKSGGSGNYTSHSSSASSFAPPMTAGGNNNNSYGNPPSPLSKLMSNVSMGGPESNRGQSFPPPQQFRAPPPTQQQYHAPPQQQRYQQPPPTAYAPPNQGPPSHAYGGPPPTGYSRGGPPPTAASNHSYHDHSGYPPSSSGPKQGNVFQQTGAAQFGQPQQFQRMPTSGSMPPTASSRSTRQAPGGTSNWSPYG